MSGASQLDDQAVAGPGLDRAMIPARLVTGLMLVLAVAALDNNIVGPALPRIVSDLGGLAHIAWVVTAFAVASTASTPLYGKLSDQYGRKSAFFVSVGLFLLGSVACGASRSMGLLIASRALQGVGAGGLIVLTQTTVGDLVPPRERGRYQGLIMGVFALCSIAGPLLGGIITDMFTWRWIFFINLPLGAAALVLLGGLPRPEARPPTQIDVAGFGLVIAGTCTLLLLLSWGGTMYAWRSAPILGLGIATLLLFGLLVHVERTAAEPALPPHLFANRVFAIGVTGLSLTVTAFFGSLVFVPLFFQMAHGASATEAGLRMAPIMGGMIVTSVIGGRLVSRTGRYKLIIMTGLAAGTLSYLALSWAALHKAPTNVFDAFLVVLGGGIGLVMANVTTAVQNAVDRRDLGVATATLGFFRSLGGAFGVAVSGTILSVTLHEAAWGRDGGSVMDLGLAQLRALPPVERLLLADAYGRALGYTFAAAAALTALALAILVSMPERPLRGR